MSSPAALPMLQVRVARKQTEALGICSFELVPRNGQPLPAFTAGAHVDVLLEGGLVRQYSLCNAPHETHRYVIGVLRETASRGGSQAMHEQIQEGTVLSISAPKNHFALAEGAAHSILLAGGIGVTPLLSMAEALSARSEPFELHCCTRSSERTAFKARLAAAPFADRVALHHDDGPQEQKLALDAVLGGLREHVHLYVCGPKGFMDAVLNRARELGWPEAQLHCEYFSAEPTPTTGQTAFEVQIASSGQIVVVPADKTVVQALAAAGVEVLTSCEQGVCGTCLTRVLHGEPDHKDLYLTPEEQAANDQFTPCCSRSRSARLVLDL